MKLYRKLKISKLRLDIPFWGSRFQTLGSLHATKTWKQVHVQDILYRELGIEMKLKADAKVVRKPIDGSFDIDDPTPVLPGVAWLSIRFSSQSNKD